MTPEESYELLSELLEPLGKGELSFDSLVAWEQSGEAAWAVSESPVAMIQLIGLVVPQGGIRASLLLARQVLPLVQAQAPVLAQALDLVERRIAGVSDDAYAAFVVELRRAKTDVLEASNRAGRAALAHGTHRLKLDLALRNMQHAAAEHEAQAMLDCAIQEQVRLVAEAVYSALESLAEPVYYAPSVASDVIRAVFQTGKVRADQAQLAFVSADGPARVALEQAYREALEASGAHDVEAVEAEIRRRMAELLREAGYRAPTVVELAEAAERVS